MYLDLTSAPFYVPPPLRPGCRLSAQPLHYQPRTRPELVSERASLEREYSAITRRLNELDRLLSH